MDLKLLTGIVIGLMLAGAIAIQWAATGVRSKDESFQANADADIPRHIQSRDLLANFGELHSFDHGTLYNVCHEGTVYIAYRQAGQSFQLTPLFVSGSSSPMSCDVYRACRADDPKRPLEGCYP